nr:hypothetical protein [Tanacetum cinerariifolium]
MNDFNWFKCDTPLKNGFDEFCQRWWMKREKKELSDSGWSNYVPNDEWKCLEVEEKDSNLANQECIGEYGLMIDDNDFEYMCDYMLSKDTPFTINNDEGRLEETRQIGMNDQDPNNVGKDYLVLFFSLFELGSEQSQVSWSWIWACIYGFVALSRIL